MKLFFPIILLCLLGATASAQEFTIKSFEAKITDMTAKIDPVLDLNGDPCALIRVAVADRNISFSGNIVNTPIYRPGEYLVYVPAGTKRIKITHPDCLPLVYEFNLRIEQNCTYELRLILPDVSRQKKMRSIVLPTISFGSSQFAYGIMVGFVKKAGAYVRYKSDFNKVSTDFDCSENGEVDGSIQPWYTGVTQKSRMSITIGYVHRLWKPLYIYFGGGYGKRTLAWETVDGTFARNTKFSYQGVEAELGAIVRFNWFALSVGVQTNSFKNLEANIGAGFMF